VAGSPIHHHPEVESLDLDAAAAFTRKREERRKRFLEAVF
jgi:hypothetical protein